MSSTNDRPRAVLYTFDGSVWASVPRIGLIEKGYRPEDVEIKVVDLRKSEHFAPSYLRINPNGTVPALVAPISDTTSPEVATKFRAITDSKEILEFLDHSRSQPILQLKGEQAGPAAPVLSPATIEGKAISDALIALVHSDENDPNFLMFAARSQDEIQEQRQSPVAQLVVNRQEVLSQYLDSVEKQGSSNSSNPDANPRSAAQAEVLKKWYTDKLHSLAPIHNVYGPTPNEQATTLHIQLSCSRYVKLARALDALEKQLVGPLALGDQMSLADVHLMAWLARVISVSQSRDGGVELEALQKAIQHDCVKESGASNVVGPKLKAYWQALKARPSFQQVYGEGLH